MDAAQWGWEDEEMLQMSSASLVVLAQLTQLNSLALTNQYTLEESELVPLTALRLLTWLEVTSGDLFPEDLAVAGGPEENLLDGRGLTLIASKVRVRG